MKSLPKKIADYWKENSNKITLVVTFIALVIFVARGLYYVEHQSNNMDEGTYLLKGKWFLNGTYQPYEKGGPITNKGVFSFWFLGLSQIIAPGLRSGRLFSLFLTLITLVGLWYVIRRMSNQTWASAILLLFSLNGFWVSVYSRALTESVSSFLITFSVLLLTSKSAKLWQTSLGLILAAITILTRQNLLPFFFFAIIYVIWQNGIKKAWFPIIIGVSFFLFFNIIYWPDIYLVMWKPYVSLIVNVFERIFHITAETNPASIQSDIGTSRFDHNFKIYQELYVWFDTIGIYIVPWIFSLFFLVTANWKKVIKSDNVKTFIFLFISFLVLIFMHFYAVIHDNNILYSLPIYPAFFLPLGLMVIPDCYKWMDVKGNFIKAAILISSVLVICTGIGIHTYRTFSNMVMFIQVPRVRNMHILPGTTELWRLLENKFHWGYKILEYIMAGGYGFVIGVLFVLTCIVLWLILRRKHYQISFTRLFTLCVLVFAVLFSPTGYLAGNPSIDVYEGSVIDALENVGNELSSIIPADSLLYWQSNSPVVLLYLEDFRMFPVQLNSYFYMRTGGDVEALLENNYWNDEIAKEWLLQADYILLGESEAKHWEPYMNSEYPGRFDKVTVTDNLLPSVDRSYLHVYHNLFPESE